MTEKIGNKKAVFFTYNVSDEEGMVLEQSDIPVGYVHGVANQMFPQLERAMKGKVVEDEIEVTLRPEEHFGGHDPSLTFSDLLDNVPAPYRSVGAEAEFKNGADETVKMTVVKVEDGKVYLDGNHPFAGKTVTYRAKITSVQDASAEEIAMGHPAQNHPYL